MRLIVERQETICWMKPDKEITQRATKAGGVQFISQTIIEEKLREWIVGTDNKIQ